LTDPQWRGNLFESVVVNHAARQEGQVYYWYSSKEKKEVDLVLLKKQAELYEVKWLAGKAYRALGTNVSPIDSSNLINFLNISQTSPAR
jgi:predicted AAA+ superfamily ATPase